MADITVTEHLLLHQSALPKLPASSPVFCMT